MFIDTELLADDPRPLRSRLKTANDYIDEARRISGLERFHSESFREGLDLLAEGITSSDVLSNDGFEYASRWLVAPLIQRLKIDDWIEQHPEIVRVAIERPVFVLGLPRTGTTILHALLGVDPRFRILWNWEHHNCVPPVNGNERNIDPRILAARIAMEGVKAAGQVTPHFVSADEPEECIFLMMQDMKALSQEHVVDNPVYRDWLFNSADMVAAYRNHKRALQLMQSHWPGRWMLKLPSHALSIASIFSVYPDARIIVPHRDPLLAAGSYCSLNSKMRNWLQREGTVDLLALGRQMFPQVVAHATRPMNYRDAHPEAPFLDVFYHRFKGDPLSEIRRIYEFIDEELNAEVEQQMRDFIAAHPEQAYGKHSYKLEDFGIGRGEALFTFKEYIERYDIPVR